MRSPLPNEFALQIPSVADGTRPNTQFGTSITPATGSHGSYASLISGASVTEEVWGILINVNNVAIGAEEHQSLVTIGLDTSGGSSFTDFINHLVCGPANAYSEPGSGVWYYSPPWGND